jgi:hypothetical protein
MLKFLLILTLLAGNPFVDHTPKLAKPSRIPYGSILPIALEGYGNVCTAFSINEKEGYWATADHCLFGDEYIYGDKIEIVMEDPQADIAVIRGPRVKALEVMAEVSDPGTPVYKWGYGNGWTTGWDSEGTLTDYLLFNRSVGHIVMIFDLLVQPGDSGSPILTYDNKVMSIVELKFRKDKLDVKNPSGGIDTPTMHDTLEPYLPGYVVRSDTTSNESE